VTRLDELEEEEHHDDALGCTVTCAALLVRSPKSPVLPWDALGVSVASRRRANPPCCACPAARCTLKPPRRDRSPGAAGTPGIPLVLSVTVAPPRKVGESSLTGYGRLQARGSPPAIGSSGEAGRGRRRPPGGVDVIILSPPGGGIISASERALTRRGDTLLEVFEIVGSMFVRTRCRVSMYTEERLK